MIYKEKLEKAKLLYAEAKAILSNSEATAEDKLKIEPLMEEAKELKADAMQLKDISEFGAELIEDIEAKEDEKVSEETKAAEMQHKDAKFDNWGEFLQAAHAAQGRDRHNPDPRLHVLVKRSDGMHEVKQMVESVGASGGFLVPTEFMAQLQAIVGENSIVRPRATVIRMNRRALQIPTLDQTATGTVGVPCWFGGMTFSWGEEAAEKDRSEPEVRQVELVAHKLYGYARASNELVADSAISLSDLMSGPLGMAGGIAWSEDFSFLQGTGAGQPQGIIAAGATITVNRAGAGAITYPDLCDMMENFLPSGKGVWVITQSAMADIIQINGPAGNPSYVWSTNAADGIPGFLFGYPVMWSEKVPALGTAGDVVLADFRYYIVGDRQATTIESTQFDYWRYDQTSWRAVHRVDGQPWLSAPLTYQDQATQVSPFVILGDVA